LKELISKEDNDLNYWEEKPRLDRGKINIIEKNLRDNLEKFKERGRERLKVFNAFGLNQSEENPRA
jgi:hypothetical protein